MDCNNDHACPFCGEAHSLIRCDHFKHDQSLESNLESYVTSGHTFKCALCINGNSETNHDHSGLDRANCPTYKAARVCKYQIDNANIPSYIINHFNNYFCAHSHTDNQPLTIMNFSWKDIEAQKRALDPEGSDDLPASQDSTKKQNQCAKN